MEGDGAVTAAAAARRDQLHAASTDARRIVRRSAGAPGVRQAEVDPSPWLRALAERIEARSAAGEVWACRHVSSSPEPVWAFAWQPDRVWCAACAVDRAEATRGSTEDRTCDVCRAVVPALTAAVVAVGPLLLTFGACDACAGVAGVLP